VALEVEEAVIAFAYEQPAYGQLRASNELRKRGILVSVGGVRSIWLRNNLETFDKRLKVLEKKQQRKASYTPKHNWQPWKELRKTGKCP
jgi:hypothetical protein